MPNHGPPRSDPPHPASDAADCAEQPEAPERSAPPAESPAAAPPPPAAESSRPAPLMVDTRGLIRPRDATEEYRLVRQYMASGALPVSFENADQVLVAFQALRALNLNPVLAIRNVAIINGQCSMWGDLPLALCRRSGELESFAEVAIDEDYTPITLANKNLKAQVFGFVCTLQRRGCGPTEAFFTRERATTAGLLRQPQPGKRPSVWSLYTHRMLQLRARGQALKDAFPDVLLGMGINEYDNDEPWGYGGGKGVPGSPVVENGPRPGGEGAADQLNQLVAAAPPAGA